MKVALAIVLCCCAAYSFSQSQATQQLTDAVSFAGLDVDKIADAVNQGADVNYIDGRFSILGSIVTVASFATQEEQYMDAYKALLFLAEHGAKLQNVDATILYFPVAAGKLDVTKKLLEMGAEARFWPRQQIGSGFGMSPIQLAAERGSVDIMNLLEENGATKPQRKEIESYQFVYASQSGKYEEVAALLKEGVYVNYVNPNGLTALSALVGQPFFRSASYQTLQVLFANAVDVNLEGRGSLLGVSTPLNLAVASTSFAYKQNSEIDYANKMLEGLLKQGAYVSGTDSYGKTPLHIAAEYNNLPAAKILIRWGSKIQPKDAAAKTPLDYAKSGEMIKYLKANGARE